MNNPIDALFLEFDDTQRAIALAAGCDIALKMQVVHDATCPLMFREMAAINAKWELRKFYQYPDPDAGQPWAASRNVGRDWHTWYDQCASLECYARDTTVWRPLTVLNKSVLLDAKQPTTAGHYPPLPRA